MTGASSELGQALFDVMKKLMKFVPAGSVSPAANKNNIEQMAMRNAQQNQQMQALKAQQAQGGQQGGQAGAQPGGQPPSMMPRAA